MKMTYTYDDATYSDLYKDARGIRPSADELRAWAAMTPDDKQVEWEALCCELDRELERERGGHDRALNAWIDRMFESVLRSRGVYQGDGRVPRLTILKGE